MKKLALLLLLAASTASALPQTQNLHVKVPKVHRISSGPKCKLERKIQVNYLEKGFFAGIELSEYDSSCPVRSSAQVYMKWKDSTSHVTLEKNWDGSAKSIVMQDNVFRDGLSYYNECKLYPNKDPECELKLIASKDSTAGRLLFNPFAYNKRQFHIYGMLSPCQAVDKGLDSKDNYDFTLRCGLQAFSNNIASIDTKLAYKLVHISTKK